MDYPLFIILKHYDQGNGKNQENKTEMNLFISQPKK